MGVVRWMAGLVRVVLLAALLAVAIWAGLWYFDVAGGLPIHVHGAAAEALGQAVAGFERAATTNAPPTTANVWSQGESRAVLQGVNAYRRDNKLAALAWDDSLAAFAQQRADDMIARGYFSHTDPVTGKMLLIELRRLTTVGENLYQVSGPAVQFMREVADATVQGWRNSPSHNALMLMPDMRRAGVAVARTPTRIVAVLIVSG